MQVSTVQVSNVKYLTSQLSMYKYPMQVSNVKVSNAKYLTSQLSMYKYPMQVSNAKYLKPKKSQPRTGKSNPPYLPNGDRLGKFYYTIGFRTLENWWIGHLQISEKKSQLSQNARVT
jgi:hypothetical protein